MPVYKSESCNFRNVSQMAADLLAGLPRKIPDNVLVKESGLSCLMPGNTQRGALVPASLGGTQDIFETF